MTQRTDLSSREQDVVDQLLQGKSNKLIATSLSISESTVEFHLKNIYAKYQVSSRTELIIKLRKSTVADQAPDGENRDTPNQWAAALKEAVSKIRKVLNMENSINVNPYTEGQPMTFFESIRVCLAKYADFNGRASRSEFWWFFLFIILAASAVVYINETAGKVFLIAFLLPFLAVGARRLRDIGYSGWWELFMLVPVGGIIILGFLWAKPPAIPTPEDTLSA